MGNPTTRLCLTAACCLAVSAHAIADPAKAPITGFIDMQTITWHNQDDGQPTFTLSNIRHFPGMFGGIVLNATWAEMQPWSGGWLVTTRIDNALAQVKRYNDAHPANPLGVKLRIYSGNQAPAWAKAINGGPLTIERNGLGCQSASCPITIGKVWDPQYIAAWRAFQRKVAARYDANPLIRSVAITSCAMETDEPFVMPTQQPPQQPIPPGYTDAAGRACLRGAVNDYAAWRLTPVDYTINPFLRIQTRKGPDVGFSISVMDECRTKLGNRCELGNHGFGAGITGNNLTVIEAIAGKGGPIHYQTVGPKQSTFVSWTATVSAARQYNATALELWPDAQFGGFMTQTRIQMKQLKALFDAR
jgi:hypothetical protein